MSKKGGNEYKIFFLRIVNDPEFPFFLHNKVLKTTGWAHFMWKDERLTWDPKDFGGIDKLSVNSNQVHISMGEIVLKEHLAFYEPVFSREILPLNSFSDSNPYHDKGQKISKSNYLEQGNLHLRFSDLWWKYRRIQSTNFNVRFFFKTLLLPDIFRFGFLTSLFSTWLGLYSIWLKQIVLSCQLE